jgi:hypothetical protein
MGRATMRAPSTAHDASTIWTLFLAQGGVMLTIPHHQPTALSRFFEFAWPVYAPLPPASSACDSCVYDVRARVRDLLAHRGFQRGMLAVALLSGTIS